MSVGRGIYVERTKGSTGITVLFQHQDPRPAHYGIASMKTVNLLPVLAVALSSLTGCGVSNIVHGGETQRFAEQQTEYWAVERVQDGQTLVLVQGDRQEEALLCGISAPALDQPLGKDSLDHLKQLLAESAEGEVGVVPLGRDDVGHLVAEVFVATGGAEEIHVNSQMVLDVLATVEDTAQGCPNSLVMVAAEDRAKDTRVGVWKAAKGSE